MRRLILVLVLLVALLAAADLILHSWVESRVESSAEEALQGVAAVEADIDSYPFLPRLLLSGEVAKITIDLTGISGDPVDVDAIRLEVEGLRFDRSELFFDSRARITDVNVVKITAVVSEATVRRLTGRDIDLGDGRATIRVGGQVVVAAAEVQGGELVFDASPLPIVRVPLPASDLLPCAVEGRVRIDALELTCTTNRLPPRLIEAIGSVDLRDALD